MEKELMEREAQYIAQTYSRFPIMLGRGSGARVWDIGGREFIDFVAGVAVNIVGHCHPKVVAAIQEQAEKLIHCSNLYYNRPQIELAELIVKILPDKLSRVFFCNSGAESVEAALKLSRKYTKRKEFIAARNSFHGRTIGALSITGQAKYRKPFEPLLSNVKFVEYGDIGDLRKKITENTAAVILEPVQGEGGVITPSTDYLPYVAEVCENYGALLVLDEVQTGFGRTGKMWGSEHSKVMPDIMCLAKGLGGGFPIGALCASDEVMSAFERGDHASTFGGGPLACAAAKASITAILEENLVEKSAEKGLYFQKQLSEIPAVERARGLGLMIGAVLPARIDGKRIVNKALELGALFNCIGKNVLRFVPPLVIEVSEIDRGVEIVKELL